MGTVQSRLNNVSQDQSQSKTWLLQSEEYFLITSTTTLNEPLVLKFDPAKSRAVCVGIDKQQNQKFLGNSLGDVATKSALLLGESFVTNMGMQKERVHVYTTTNTPTPQLCTKEAIKALIFNYAREVEEDGMFVFYFSGYMLVFKTVIGKDEWVHVLAPGDFVVGDVKTGITADNFVEWIRDANCKARNILVILDCCHAGGIGERITAAVDTIKPQLHVMCACAAEETTPPMNVLGNSIFCYFLLHVLNKHQPKGKFVLNENMGEITELCQSFSSLLMTYSSERGGLLMPALFKPEVYSVIHGSDDGIDSSDGFHNLKMLFDFYDIDARKPSLHQVAIQWLKSRAVQDSLRLLLSLEPPRQSLYDGILCALFYSVSCIHLAYDRTHITERNLFITAAISIVSAIGFSYSEASITIEQLRLGLQYYYLPIKSAGISIGSIAKLFIDLHVHDSDLTTGNAVDQNMVSAINYLNMQDISMHVLYHVCSYSYSL